MSYPGNNNGRKSGYSNTTQIRESDAGVLLLTESDGGQLIRMNSETPQSVQLSDNVAPGFEVEIMQAGAGETSFLAIPGITILSRPGSILNGQNAVAKATCIAASTWVLSGDLTSGG